MTMILCSLRVKLSSLIVLALALFCLSEHYSQESAFGVESSEESSVETLAVSPEDVPAVLYECPKFDVNRLEDGRVYTPRDLGSDYEVYGIDGNTSDGGTSANYCIRNPLFNSATAKEQVLVDTNVVSAADQDSIANVSGLLALIESKATSYSNVCYLCGDFVLEPYKYQCPDFNVNQLNDGEANDRGKYIERSGGYGYDFSGGTLWGIHGRFGSGRQYRYYCWDNPFFNPETPENRIVTQYNFGEVSVVTRDVALGLKTLFANLISQAQSHTTACYVCGNFRVDYSIRNQGCFPPGERILLADGNYKKVEEIAAGDTLYNPVSKKEAIVKNIVEGPEEIPLMEIGDEQGTVRLTQDHPVLTDKGVKQAVALKVGDTIFDKDNNKRQLSTVRMLPIAEGQYVINLELDVDSNSSDEHLIVSEGIITGDWALQNLIKKKR